MACSALRSADATIERIHIAEPDASDYAFL
jgi:hypothetical protein